MFKLHWSALETNSHHVVLITAASFKASLCVLQEFYLLYKCCPFRVTLLHCNHSTQSQKFLPSHKIFFKGNPLITMANNSIASDARSPMTKVAKLTEKVAALEESTYTLTLDNCRLKVKHRCLKKSYNRLAGRFLRLKEKYATVVAKRDRLAREEV